MHLPELINGKVVLILIVMDDGRRLEEHTAYESMEEGLNPYCNGWWSPPTTETKPTYVGS